MPKTDQDWKAVLTPEQYRIMRQGGTEAPFTGALLENKENGTYLCGCCSYPLFSSTEKYNSGSGWPSFKDVLDQGNVTLRTDTSHNMVRTEALCANCGAHLGHVFDDGPGETGKRYCINSASLGFEKAGEKVAD